MEIHAVASTVANRGELMPLLHGRSSSCRASSLRIHLGENERLRGNYPLFLPSRFVWPHCHTATLTISNDQNESNASYLSYTSQNKTILKTCVKIQKPKPSEIITKCSEQTAAILVCMHAAEEFTLHHRPHPHPKYGSISFRSYSC